MAGKLTEAQWRCLTIIGRNKGKVGYGSATGVKREVVKALWRRGLVDYEPAAIDKVVAEILPAGAAALATKEGE